MACTTTTSSLVLSSDLLPAILCYKLMVSTQNIQHKYSGVLWKGSRSIFQGFERLGSFSCLPKWSQPGLDVTITSASLWREGVSGSRKAELFPTQEMFFLLFSPPAPRPPQFGRIRSQHHKKDALVLVVCKHFNSTVENAQIHDTLDFGSWI